MDGWPDGKPEITMPPLATVGEGIKSVIPFITAVLAQCTEHNNDNDMMMMMYNDLMCT